MFLQGKRKLLQTARNTETLKRMFLQGRRMFLQTARNTETLRRMFLQGRRMFLQTARNTETSTLEQYFLMDAKCEIQASAFATGWND